MISVYSLKNREHNLIKTKKRKYWTIWKEKKIEGMEKGMKDKKIALTSSACSKISASNSVIRFIAFSVYFE